MRRWTQTACLAALVAIFIDGPGHTQTVDQPDPIMDAQTLKSTTERARSYVKLILGTGDHIDPNFGKKRFFIYSALGYIGDEKDFIHYMFDPFQLEHSAFGKLRVTPGHLDNKTDILFVSSNDLPQSIDTKFLANMRNCSPLIFAILGGDGWNAA